MWVYCGSNMCLLHIWYSSDTCKNITKLAPIFSGGWLLATPTKYKYKNCYRLAMGAGVYFVCNYVLVTLKNFQRNVRYCVYKTLINETFFGRMVGICKRNFYQKCVDIKLLPQKESLFRASKN